MQSKISDSQPALVKASIFIASAIPAGLVLLFLIKYACDIPYADDWELIPILRKLHVYHTVSLSDLASQHNEHRILFPRIIMLAIAELTAWNQKYEMYASFLIMCGTFYLLFLNIKRVLSLQSTIQMSFVLPLTTLTISTIYFGLSQQENILWGWQIQIYLNIFAIVAGAYLITRGGQLTVLSFVLALVFGIIATYSFANGILFWPLIGLAIALLDKQPNKLYYLGVLVAVFALVLLVYYTNYQRPGKLEYVSSKPINYVLYFLSYIGSPVLKMGLQVLMPVYIGGIVGIICLAILSMTLWKFNLIWKREFLFWHILLGYALVSAAVTAVGRSDFGIGQSLSSRYITISNLAWLWIVIVSVFVVLRINIYPKIGIFFISLITVLLLAYYDKVLFVDYKLMYNSRVLAQKALRENRYGDPSIFIIHWQGTVQSMRAENEFLRKYKLSFYHNN